jgi:hypothetical protein
MVQRPQQFQAQIMMPPQSPTKIFSPQYARMVGARPRATSSANIGLGGVRR